jgi:hypothetical protein
MALKGLFRLALCLLEAVLLSQGFGLPALLQVDVQPHLPQETIEMLLSHLNGAKRPVPLAAFARPHHGLHILDHRIGERQNGQEVSHHTGLGFPPALR